MAYVDFPRQKLSRRKKTQKWGEECIEAGGTWRQTEYLSNRSRTRLSRYL